MEVKTKSSNQPKSPTSSDSFLFDAVRPQPRHLGLGDGFRFGLGFLLAALLMSLILAAIVLVIAAKLPAK